MCEFLKSECSYLELRAEQIDARGALLSWSVHGHAQGKEWDWEQLWQMFQHCTNLERKEKLWQKERL